MTNANVDSMRVHHETWAQQLKDAMNVNGGDVENASTGDYIMHFLTFGFKVNKKIVADHEADLHVKAELPKYALIRYKSVGFLKAYSAQ